jgi:plastocyanin
MLAPGFQQSGGDVMGSRVRPWVAVAIVGVGLVSLPAVASAKAAKVSAVVYAGPPPLTNSIARTLVPKSFRQYNPDINAFFNARTTINAGQTVSFRVLGFHSVDLAGPSNTDLPLLVPGATVTSTNDAAGNPFWFNGKVPNLGLNPQLLAPGHPTSYNGSTRADSGLAPRKPWNVTFTKPGVYKFFCDVHPGMIGYIVVKAKGKAVPTTNQNQATEVKTVVRDIKVAKKLAKTKIPKDTVDLGEGASDGVELYAMFPATLTVSAGTVVSFVMPKHSDEVHTATFGPPSYLNPLIKAVGSAPVFPPQAIYPSDATMPLVLTPTSHGNGFVNTGALTQDASTHLPSSGTIDFTTPGTYHYQCLIHPFMHGTIIVK